MRSTSHLKVRLGFGWICTVATSEERVFPGRIWSAHLQLILAGLSWAELLAYGGSTDFSDAKLCSAKLDFADMSKANLSGACLCDAWLGRTDLSSADLRDASLHRALFWGPVLSGARLSSDGRRPAKGVVQSDLDRCLADPDDLPEMDGVRDAETGEPLHWSGRPPQTERLRWLSIGSVVGRLHTTRRSESVREWEAPAGEELMEDMAARPTSRRRVRGQGH